MISANNISVYFGGQELFDNVSFMVNKGDRIGLVGKNGAGKSTLLRILSGEQSPNEGSISSPNDSTLGYLRQDLDFEEGRTVQQEAELAFNEIKELEEKINAINLEMSERTDYETESYMQLITDLNELNERYGLLGGYTIQSEMSQVLLGLGFQLDDFSRQTNEFSGGWRMRLELAKILLSKPDVLLLDEPTNHLDIESIVWLESWLKNYSGAVVLVSHDRAFLDAVTNRTIDLILGKANDYKASYSKYVELRKDRQEKQIQSKKNQDKEVKQTKMLIDKFRYKKSKASFAQSLIKKLDKMEMIEVEQDETASMHFKFPPAPHSGKVTLKVNEVSKSYDELEVLKGFGRKINELEFIFTEVNRDYLYSDNVLIWDLDKYLYRLGFVRTWTSWRTADMPWGDAFYMKTSRISKYGTKYFVLKNLLLTSNLFFSLYKALDLRIYRKKLKQFLNL